MCVCASFVVNFGTVLQSLFSTLLQSYVRIQRLLPGCNGLPCNVQVILLQPVVGLHASPGFSAVGSLSPCRQIPGARSTVDRQATCQVAATQAATPKSESAKMFVPLAAEPALVVVWTRKVVLGTLRLVGRTPKQQCEDPLPDLWKGVQSEAELNKRLLAGLAPSFCDFKPSCASRGVLEISRRSCSDISKERTIDVRSSKLSVATAVCRDLWIAWQSRLSVVKP